MLLTGKMGDVMQESAKASMSYVRSVPVNSDLIRILQTMDIHIHIPRGRYQGRSICRCYHGPPLLCRQWTGRSVMNQYAMTGELTWVEGSPCRRTEGEAVGREGSRY
jgi:ATP-dependent Lon protease